MAFQEFLKWQRHDGVTTMVRYIYFSALEHFICVLKSEFGTAQLLYFSFSIGKTTHILKNNKIPPTKIQAASEIKNLFRSSWLPFRFCKG